MSSNSISIELALQLEELPLNKQQQVLDYARTLATNVPVGKPGKDFLKYVGMISKEDLIIMEQAIDEHCGKVDPNAW